MDAWCAWSARAPRPRARTPQSASECTRADMVWLELPLPPSKAETVSSLRTQPVSGKEQIFVQAGAYIGFPNASKARTRLSRFGAAWLSETRVGRQKYYRVRIGPLQSVDDADKVLSQIISAGFPKARIVVD